MTDLQQATIDDVQNQLVRLAGLLSLTYYAYTAMKDHVDLTPILVIAEEMADKCADNLDSVNLVRVAA